MEGRKAKTREKSRNLPDVSGITADIVITVQEEPTDPYKESLLLRDVQGFQHICRTQHSGAVHCLAPHLHIIPIKAT
jgi:hypothetical protein